MIPGLETIASCGGHKDPGPMQQPEGEWFVNMDVIDMSGLNMVDSVGIGVIIATFNSLKKTGGEFKLSNVSKDIFSLFSTMRLDQHFSIKKAG